MINTNQNTPRAFAVWFKDLNRWDPASFRRIIWHWPKDVMSSIGSVLQVRKEKVDRSHFAFPDLQPVTIHFAVYEPDRSKLLPEYLQCIIQAGFFKAHLWRNKVGAEGRKEVKLTFFESLQIPLPLLSIQEAIVAHLRKARQKIEAAKASLQQVTDDLNTALYSRYYANTKEDILHSRSIIVNWKDISAWNVNNARAAAFRIANPSFKLLGNFAEEATELVKPWEEPEKEWPVYGVTTRKASSLTIDKKGKTLMQLISEYTKIGFSIIQHDHRLAHLE